MNKYTFRFGTYGSNNPLIYAEKKDGEYIASSHPWGELITPSTVDTEGLHNFTIYQVEDLFASSNHREELRVESRNASLKSFQINFDKYDFSKYTLLGVIEFYMTCEISPPYDELTGEILSMYLSADMEVAIGYVANGTTVVKEQIDKYAYPISESKYAHNFKISITDDFLKNNTLKYFRFKIILEGDRDNMWATSPTIVISDFNIKVLEEVAPPVDTNKYVVADDESGKKHKIYLCPWELKHVDSISISVSGDTTTMGLPGQPASRTQIFDTAGAVRVFKISGRRYDWEEDISNWDFLNTQYNFSEDPVAGKSPDPDGYYCYIGLSWLLSNIQVLLKGYYLYIGRNEADDHRFIGFKPSEPTGNKPRGYNVAITGLNTSFSESEPGLLNYTITLTERFKYGDALYKPYKPDFVIEEGE